MAQWGGMGAMLGVRAQSSLSFLKKRNSMSMSQCPEVNLNA